MRLVDCSQPLESGMPVYPGDDAVSISELATLPEDASRISSLDLSSHVGTHVDAPAHKVPGGRTLDEFPVSAFAFAARLVDCTSAADRDSLQTDHLPSTLRQDPGATDVDMLVFRTGWSDHWGTDRYRDSPYLAPGLADWCAERGFHVGIDTFSPDPVPSADPQREGADEPTDQPAHAALCGAGHLIVENLRGLGRLPDRFGLRALPLRLRDGDGSPVRAVATVPEEQSP
ncbi:MAG: cyclase family protein [Haloarculaceae archaeon]